MIISGSLHILKKGAPDDSKFRRAISAIETATKRGAALTGQLLTFARRQSVNPQAIHFGDRVEAIREVLNAGVGSVVGLAFDIEREVWPVKADVSEFETGLLNLVINARDAMPDGGTVTIGAHNIVLDDRLHSGEFVAITVADTGLGIPSDVVDRIFEPFFTTKPVGKGTGLGLSQVHGFAHQAGGTVKVASELGKGTTFTILLPRATATGPNQTLEAAPVCGSGTVLLVEDNPDVAIVSTGLLEQLGYRVRRVADAESALRELENNGVDFVFSDIVMPGKMDGLSLAHHLRQVHPDLPILLASGYSEAATGVRGDFPILRKPYEIHELSEAISKLPR
jgi:CheY-like chemotaxis protein